MAAITLENLPADIHATISEDLWQTSPSSVLELAATSQTLKEVAAPFIYRCLQINISTPGKLVEDVKRLKTTEDGSLYLQYARHIKLNGYMNHKATASPDTEDDKDSEDTDESLCPGTNFALDEPLYPYFNEVILGNTSGPDRESEVPAWKPLVDLIGEFQHLSDILWECHGSFMPGLLDAIHTYHRDCRLHVRKFRFLSLHQAVTDPDELALASSPNLHSISIISAWRMSSGDDDFNNEAAMRVLKTAPNLKHFRNLGARPASSPQLANARGRPRKVWPGFQPPLKRDEKATLETFSTCCYSDEISLKELHTWAEYFDFPSLRKAHFAVKDAKVLEELIVGSMLANLKELSITLQRNKNDEQYEAAAESFFRGLSGLRSLELSGTIHRDLLNVICNCHGPTLEQLAIKPYEDFYDMAGPPYMLQAEDIEQFAQTCPNLTTLDIKIKRTKGDNRETRCYEALGKLCKLKTIKLYLDCSNDPQRPRDSITGGFIMGAPSSNPDVMETALINSAMDETLARSIWDIAATPSLETLSVANGGGEMFGRSSPGDLMTVVGSMSRHYKLERVRDEVRIVEVSKVDRESRDKWRRDHELVMLEKWGHRGNTGPAFEALEKLWGDHGLDGDRANWRDIWSSFPLQRSC